MSNMSYCRFENTLRDLRECYIYWTDETSIAEGNAREMLLSLCQVIANRHGHLIVRHSEANNETTT